MSRFPKYRNQGQQIVLGWNNTSTLKDWVAYVGNDGEPFLPPDDRNGFTDGIERRLPTGRVLMAGVPISRQTFPVMTYGQVDYLMDTFDGQNVTVSIHKPNSVTKTDIYHYNAVVDVNLNQTDSLQREGNTYKLFVVALTLVEPL